MHRFLRHRAENRQTDMQTNGGKNPTPPLPSAWVLKECCRMAQHVSRQPDTATKSTAELNSQEILAVQSLLFFLSVFLSLICE